MTNAEIRLERERLKFEREKARLDMAARAGGAVVDLGKNLLSNPIVCMVAAFAAIEYMQIPKTKWYQDPNTKVWIQHTNPAMIGPVAGTLLEGAVVTVPIATSVVKSGLLNEIFKTGAETAKSAGSVVKDIAPLLLMAGA